MSHRGTHRPPRRLRAVAWVVALVIAGLVGWASWLAQGAVTGGDVLWRRPSPSTATASEPPIQPKGILCRDLGSIQHGALPRGMELEVADAPARPGHVKVRAPYVAGLVAEVQRGGYELALCGGAESPLLESCALTRREAVTGAGVLAARFPLYVAFPWKDDVYGVTPAGRNVSVPRTALDCEPAPGPPRSPGTICADLHGEVDDGSGARPGRIRARSTVRVSERRVVLRGRPTPVAIVTAGDIRVITTPAAIEHAGC